MFPSFHEFKSEPIAPLQYDPYFPSHNAGACTGGSGSSGPSPVTSINSEVGTDLYNTYQNNGGGYSQYPTPQSWSGSSTGSQPSPSPHNYYTDTGPGPPLNGGSVEQSYYNNQQNYSGQQAAAAQASSNPNQGQQMGYYSQQQPCNQYTADQYNYTNYNGVPPWDPPPGSSPPPLYQQYGQIKNEYIEMKTPQQVQQSHPGAIPPNSYYGGGNGHVSPHHISPHLMHPGMSGPQGPPPPSMMQHDSWGGPKMQVRPLLLLPDKLKVLALLEGHYLKNKFVKQLAYESLTCKSSLCCTIVQIFNEKVFTYPVDPNDFS